VYEISSEKELDDYLRGKEILPYLHSATSSPALLLEGEGSNNTLPLLLGEDRGEVEKDEIQKYFLLRYDGLNIGVELKRSKTGSFTNTFAKEWQRR
jgi:hypothetical protein